MCLARIAYALLPHFFQPTMVMSNTMKKDQLLSEIEDLLRTMPAVETLHLVTGENIAWLGRLKAVIEVWNLAKAFNLDLAITDLHKGFAQPLYSALTTIQIMLHEARHDLRMKTIGPLNTAIGKGLVFDYFDEVRKLIEPARKDLFFIDPYIDAEFVSRYLGHVASGVSIRLLAREKLSTLIPAVEAFAK